MGVVLVANAVRERERSCSGKLQQGIEVEKVLSFEKMRQETEQPKLVLLTDNPFIPSGTSGRSVDVWFDVCSQI